MQHFRHRAVFDRLVGRAGARMVRDHAPALRVAVVDVAGDHMRLGRPFVGHHVDALDHAVHRAGERAHAVHPLRPHRQAAARQQRLEAGADRGGADQPAPAGVHADDLVFVGPAGHQPVEVARLQRFIEHEFGVVSRAADGGGLESGFGHGRSPGRVAKRGRASLPLNPVAGIPSMMTASHAVQSCTPKDPMKRWLLILFTIVTLSGLSGCGYNDFQRLDEQTKSAWSEVLNQYQRRADLVPNIVATVKSETQFEQDTLTKVIEARAKATLIQVTPETLNDPAAFAKFQAAQGELGNALSRLMVTVERYPDLKSNKAFSDLRVQLEGTENRITVARNRYIQSVQQYNVLVRSFPTNLTAMVFHYQPKPNFTVQDEAQISTPPTVDFGKK